jgi:hypothetical protein
MNDISNLDDGEAKVVLKYLIQMLNQHGLSDIHQIVSDELRSNELIMKEAPSKYLKNYIIKTIRVLNNRSSDHYDLVLRKLNENIFCENHYPIQGVKLQLSPSEMELTGLKEVDLIKLPDYSILIFGLKDILGENNRDGLYE